MIVSAVFIGVLSKDSLKGILLMILGYREGGIEPYQIEWKADENHWNDVIRMINSGTEVIQKVISR